MVSLIFSKLKISSLALVLAVCITLIDNYQVQGAEPEKEVIAIQTKNTTLIYTLDKGNISRNYYGSKFNNAKEYLKSSLAGDGPLYPSYEGKTSTESALRVTHANGVLSTELTCTKYTQTSVDANIQLTKFNFKDKANEFFVTIFIKSYFNEDVIETWAEYQNDEAGTVSLKDFASGYIPIKAEKYFLTKFHGAWFNEMRMEEQEITQGNFTLQSIQGIRTTHNLNPSFIVSIDQPATEDEGEVIGGALSWSGSWKISFEKDARKKLNITAGINGYASTISLKKGEKFKTANLLFTYSATGKGTMSRNFHSWARKYGLRDGDIERPIVLNSWEGNFFDFDEAKIIKMIKDGAEMGVELFVLDDGWFGSEKYQRDNDKIALGDWEVNKKRFPNGLEPVIEEAKKNNMKMGIWVEPEMINPQSELYEKHPEWVLQEKGRSLHPTRNQNVLDLSNPAVKNYVFDIVSNILKKYPYVSYIKWDCNSSITNPGSTFLTAAEQEEFWVKYNKNFYSICDSLIKAHPKVIFQVCASGGGRVDYGSLPYFHEFWTSDNTEALQRVFIQHGTSFFFPALATAAHVTKAGNSPLKYKFDVAMSGRMGIELLPHDLKNEEVVYAKSAVEAYKQIRPIVQFGDLYRIVSPYESSLSSLMYVNNDKSKAVVFVYQMKRLFGDYYPNIKLKGLRPDAKYKITEINQDVVKPKTFSLDESIFSGEFLMKNGLHCGENSKRSPLSVNLKSEFSSAVFLIETVK